MLKPADKVSVRLMSELPGCNVSVVQHVTHVPGLKCYLCVWTVPFQQLTKGLQPTPYGLRFRGLPGATDALRQAHERTLGMYEHRTRRLLTWPEFLRRVRRHLLWAFLIVSCALGIGTVGYRAAGKLNWVDAFLNASMILGGMGPVDRMETTPGKIFAALYALFSGLVFITVMGVVFAPWVHRVIHWMHLDQK